MPGRAAANILPTCPINKSCLIPVLNETVRMSLMKLLLTKSRFKIGADCSTKLFYFDDQQYTNRKMEDSFLRALAEGGFQVGELAKLYHPGGSEVRERDYAGSEATTHAHLCAPFVTLFESAIQHHNLFVRIDVLVKKQDVVEVIEVKEKIFDCRQEDPFFTKKGTLRSDWLPYLLDVAFQSYVARKAYPDFKVSSFLMLADKNAMATVDGINQSFLFSRGSDGKSVVNGRSGLRKHDLGEPLLCKINVDAPVEYILTTLYGSIEKWETYVASLSNLFTTRSKYTPQHSASCKSCEFRSDPKSEATGLKSGFLECWSDFGITENDYNRPLVFDVWNFRRTEEILSTGRKFMDQLTVDEISPTVVPKNSIRDKFATVGALKLAARGAINSKKLN
jgi:hypothetical protein